jgi:hypothetical protein
MEEKLFDLIGLGVPFYLGAATYGVFYWLDSNASDEATKVISSWLHGRSRNKPDLGNLIISAFDRIYTSPLLTFRAFRRSAAITSIIWLLVCAVPFPSFINYLSERLQVASHFARIPISLSDFIASIVLYLFTTILSDYLSLPFVKQFLRFAQSNPIKASVFSSFVGLIVVAVSFFVLNFLVSIAIYWTNPYFRTHDVFPINELFFSYFATVEDNWFLILSLYISTMRPAFIIHLWLPLFALSSLVVQLIFWIFRAVEKAQWFLKQGDAHPLKAIGIVATIVVFGSAMLVKEAWTVL